MYIATSQIAFKLIGYFLLLYSLCTINGMSDNDLEPLFLTWINLNRSMDKEFIRVYETSAGCLRSIYPRLGMRQLFGDVTMGQWRHN